MNKTIEYYKFAKKERVTRTAKFLWNAKMRFGKTFASYQLAKRMGFTKILILTFKPIVQSPWEIESGAGQKEIIKRECYVFDFALDRALRQISDYSCQLIQVLATPGLTNTKTKPSAVMTPY